MEVDSATGSHGRKLYSKESSTANQPRLTLFSPLPSWDVLFTTHILPNPCRTISTISSSVLPQSSFVLRVGLKHQTKHIHTNSGSKFHISPWCHSIFIMAPWVNKTHLPNLTQTNSSNLKMDTWKTIRASFWGPSAYFQVQTYCRRRVIFHGLVAAAQGTLKLCFSCYSKLIDLRRFIDLWRLES